MKKHSAFSLIELSIVILIIGILVAGVTQGSRLISEMRLSSARTQTQSSPITSISGLRMWLDTTTEKALTNSNDITDVEDGDKIKSWNDYNQQSVTKINATQSSDSLRPLYKTNIINNLPALQFDGINDYFSTTNITDRDFTLFVVLKTSSAGTSGQGYLGNPILWSEVPGATNDVIPLSIGGGYPKIFMGSAVESTLTGSVLVNDNKPHIITTLRNMTSGLRAIYVDGASAGSETTTVVGALNNTSTAVLGGDNVGGKYFPGYIAEMIVFDKVLKAEERDAVKNYLAKKWKITVS